MTPEAVVNVMSSNGASELWLVGVPLLEVPRGSALAPPAKTRASAAAAPTTTNSRCTIGNPLRNLWVDWSGR
jgi:hypothetical protein